MKAQKLSCREFRNLKEFDFLPCDDVNVICGDNAQGKTNLIEALWLFTGGRSFRGSKDSELIRLKSGMKAKLFLDFYAHEREQNARIEIFENHPYSVRTAVFLIFKWLPSSSPRNSTLRSGLYFLRPFIISPKVISNSSLTLRVPIPSCQFSKNLDKNLRKCYNFFI